MDRDNVGLPRLLRIARALAFVLALAAAAASAASQPQSWIGVSAGEKYRIVDGSVEQVFPVLVALNGVARADVKLAKVLVLRDNVPLSAERAAGFIVDSALVDAGTSPVANIRVVPGKVTLPGTYEIWISAQAVKPPKTSPQILKVSVEHPAATVAVLEPVKIRIVRGDPAIEATPLKLELKGEVVRLDNPVLGPVVFPEANVPVTGTVEPKARLQAFDKSAVLQRDWKTTGKFPLGTFEGVAQLKGDQLKEPVPIKVSVKARRSYWWLYGAAALGLMFGFFVKVVLEHYLELQRARAEGQSVLAEARSQLDRNPDESLAEALKDDLIALEQKLEQKDKKAITEAADKVRKALPEKLAELRQSQRDTKSAIDTLLVEIASPRVLPDTVAAVVTQATEDLGEAAELVTKSVAASKRKFDESKRGLVRGLQDTIAAWKRSVRDSLLKLQDASALALPLEVSQLVSGEASTLAKHMDTALDTEDLSAEASAALLDKLDREREQARIGMLKPVFDRLSGVIGMLLQQLQPLFVQHPEFPAKIRSALAEVEGKVLGGTLEQALHALSPGGADEVHTLDDRIRELFDTIRAGDRNDQDAIDALVGQRNYLAAAARLRQSSAPAREQATEDLLLGGGAAAAQQAMAAAASSDWRAKVFVPAPRYVQLTPLAASSPVKEMQLSLTRTRRQIMFAEGLQTALIGVLFGLIAYATYADQFIGTCKELIAIFLWAFSVDFTVAKVAEAGKAVKLN